MTRDHEPEPLSPERLEQLIRDRFERPLPKRFYKEVSVTVEGPEFGIALDGRPVKTPMKAAFVLPGRALADAVAAEWMAQIGVINPALMPLTRLANTAIDRVAPERERIIGEIMEFAGSDLICYWAEGPLALVENQQRHWQPVLDWAAGLGARFTPTRGLVHRPQDGAALAAYSGFLGGFSSWQLCAIHNLTSLTGSALIAGALAAGAMEGQAGWAAAHVDEDWQIAHWGEDAEAARRRAARKDELEATLGYLSLL